MYIYYIYNNAIIKEKHVEKEIELRLSVETSLLANCQSKDKGRDNINCLYLDAVNRKAVATNGHMIAIRDLTSEEVPEKSISLSLKKSLKNEEIFYCNGIAKATREPGNSCEYSTDWQYPDYLRVLPKEPEAENLVEITLSAEYIAALAKTVNGSPKGGITFTLDRANLLKPVKITGSIKGTVGYLMPMKVNN